MGETNEPQLDAELRALITCARDVQEPTDAERLRVLARLVTRLARRAVADARRAASRPHTFAFLLALGLALASASGGTRAPMARGLERAP